MVLTHWRLPMPSCLSRVAVAGVLVLATQPARAQVTSFVVKDATCKIIYRPRQAKSAGGWKTAPGSLLKKGTRVAGRSAKGGDYLMFVMPRRPKFLFAGRSKCFAKATASGPASAAGADSGAIEQFIGFGVTSWPETLTLNPAGEGVADVTMNSHTFATALNYQWGTRAGAWIFGARAGLMYGLGHVSTPATSDENFSARNVRVFGLMAAPRILWVAPIPSIAFGLSLPVVYRRMAFSELPAGVTVSPASRLAPGVWLEARLVRSSWGFSQAIGTFRGIKGFSWLFEITYGF